MKIRSAVLWVLISLFAGRGEMVFGESSRCVSVTVTDDPAAVVSPMGDDFIVYSDQATITLRVEPVGDYVLVSPAPNTGGAYEGSHSKPETLPYKVVLGEGDDEEPHDGKIFIVDFSVDESESYFFRDTAYQLPVSILPAEVEDAFTVDLSGFDVTHWTASYDAPLKRIDFSNLIESSSAVGWLDEQSLSMGLRLDGALVGTPLLKNLKLRKRLPDLSESIVDAGVDALNDVVNTPANLVKDKVIEEMNSMFASDGGGNLHLIPPGAIDQAGNAVFDLVNNWWATDVLNFLPTEDLPNDPILESWAVDLSLDVDVQFTGGILSLSPGIPDVVEWYDSIAAGGFSSDLLEFEAAEITGGITIINETPSSNLRLDSGLSLKYIEEAGELGLGFTINLGYSF